MKATELRKKSVEDLTKEMLALLKEQFNLRTQRGVGQPPKPHLYRKVRRSIALVKTILSEKGLST